MPKGRGEVAYRMRWKLILLYIVVAGIAYAAIYFLFLAPPLSSTPSGGGGGLYP
jgi:hypothetical protein